MTYGRIESLNRKNGTARVTSEGTMRRYWITEAEMGGMVDWKDYNRVLELLNEKLQELLPRTDIVVRREMDQSSHRDERFSADEQQAVNDAWKFAVENYEPEEP